MTPISAPGIWPWRSRPGGRRTGCSARPGPWSMRWAPCRSPRPGMPPATGAKNRNILLFGLNALLNILRSELFFGPHRPDWAPGHAPDLAHRELAARPLPRLGDLRRHPQSLRRPLERPVRRDMIPPRAKVAAQREKDYKPNQHCKSGRASAKPSATGRAGPPPAGRSGVASDAGARSTVGTPAAAGRTGSTASPRPAP